MMIDVCHFISNHLPNVPCLLANSRSSNNATLATEHRLESLLSHWPSLLCLLSYQLSALLFVGIGLSVYKAHNGPLEYSPAIWPPPPSGSGQRRIYTQQSMRLCVLLTRIPHHPLPLLAQSPSTATLLDALVSRPKSQKLRSLRRIWLHSRKSLSSRCCQMTRLSTLNILNTRYRQMTRMMSLLLIKYHPKRRSSG